MRDDLSHLARMIIDFDPAHPEARFFRTAAELASAEATGLRADPVTFPGDLSPTLNPSLAQKNPSAPLPKVDVIIVTWTAAEADTLATILTPGASLDDWCQYKSNLSQYLPLVTGPKAPFNDRSMPRYFQSLGIYYPIKLAGKNVLCLKSGLHLDLDTDPAKTPAVGDIPLLRLWRQMIREAGADLVITTGTGGAIGANVLLGDVVIAAQTVFDCTKQFAQEPFHESSYATTPIPAGWAAPPAKMLEVNARRVARSGLPSHPDGLPVIYYSGSGSAIPVPKIVTTDSFAFDNTTNSFGLQALGNVCDMGDASLGLVINSLREDGEFAPAWAAIRNASDPQIDGNLSSKEQNAEAGNIYIRYGALTSAASVLASWSLICSYYQSSIG